MQAYLSLPLLAALIACGSGAAILALGPQNRANRMGAVLMGSVAWWGACEVFWNVAPSASAALAWHRVATLGFVFVSAHTLTFLYCMRERALTRLRRWIPICYAVNAGFLVLTWSTDLVLGHMQREPWGYGLVPGPLMPLWLAATLWIVAISLYEWSRASVTTDVASDRIYARASSLYVGLGALAAATTDIILPMIGYQVPRLGSFLVSTAGIAILFVLGRMSYPAMNAAGLALRTLEMLPDAVSVISPRGRVRAANPRMQELLGTGADETDGLPIDEHLEIAVADPGLALRSVECELMRADGQRIPVSVSTAPLRHGSGPSFGVVLLMRDLREMAALRTRLVTSGRLAIIGELATGIAHEINNPLAFVRANLHHLERECARLAEKGEGCDDAARGALAELDEVIHESLEGVERAARIVQEVAALSHGGGGERRPADLNEAIDQALRVASLGLPPQIRVERVSGRVPEVMGSPEHLKQLFLNLILNAVQAVEAGGSVSVETRTEGDHAVAIVRDNGCGIAAEDVARIFDPFFTTRGAGDGSGLGLSICHEIVRAHHGTIDLESAPGKGTRVRVSLPRRAE